MPDHLTVTEVLPMHTDQIDRYGGTHGVRDHGLLEPHSSGRKPVITPT
jgi:death-on-curing protein